ncbi:MAG: hypothetical protein ACTSVA_05630 [Candidatus Njordarchaeales archaeon]
MKAKIMNVSRTTIAVSKDVKLSLTKLKLEEGARTFDELLRKMIIAYRKMKFLESSKRFKKRMEEKGIKLEELLND